MSWKNKEFTEKDVEKAWDESGRERKGLKEFVEICSAVRNLMGKCKKVVGKKRFQKMLMENIEGCFVGEVGDEVGRELSNMIWVLKLLMLKRKLKVEIKIKFVEKLFYCFEKWVCEGKGKCCEMVLVGILGVLDCFVKMQLLGSVEDVVYPKFSEVMEVICKVENPVLCVGISFRYCEQVENKSVDLTVVALEIYKNYVEKSCRNFNLYEIFANFFNKVKISIENIEKCELECEKFLILLSIAKVMIAKDKNFIHEFFSRFGEKVKQVFVLCISSYSRSSLHYDVTSQLELLFEKLYELLKMISEDSTSTILIMPMVVFQLLFNQVINSQPEKFNRNFLKQLKLLALKFIWRFYFEQELSKISLLDILIPQLIFSYFFFVDKADSEELWEKMWTRLSKPTNFSRKTAKMIFEELVRNTKHTEYIQQFNFWLQDVSEKNSAVYELLKNFGLYKEIILLLRNENSFEVEYELVLILNHGVLLENHNSENISMLSKEVLEVFEQKTTPEIAEIYEIVIKELLCKNSKPVLSMYLNFLKTCKTNITILSALKSFERAYKIDHFVFFLESEKLNFAFFQVFIKITPAQQEDSHHIIDIWKSLLSSLFLIASSPALSFTNPTELSLLPLLQNLRNFPNQKKDIFVEVFDPLLQILLSSHEKIIRFPPGIPLLAEILCENYKNLAAEYLILMRYFRESRINFRLISAHGFFSVFFYNLMKNKEFGLWEQYQDLCFHLISSQFTIFDLENWIDLYSSWNLPQAKVELLKLLTYGIKKKDFEEQVQRYSYFTPNSFLTFDYSQLSLYIKEFSIVLFFYIENLEKFNILTIKTNNSTVFLILDSNTVSVRINNCTETAKIRLEINCWNFLVVNIGSKKTSPFGRQSQISVFANGKFGDVKENKDFRLPNSNKIEKVCIGNSELIKELKNFVGKISFLGIMKKQIENELLDELYQGRTALTKGEIEKVLVKAGKDPKDYALLDPLNEFLKGTLETFGVYQITSIPTLATIKLFGIRRLLLEIRKSIRSEEVLQEFFEFIKTMAKHDQYLPNTMFNTHTIRFLARMLKKCELSEEICYTLTDIIRSIYDNSKILIEVIIYTETLFEHFKYNKTLLQFILDIYKKFFHFTQENLFTYCNLIRHLPFNEFSEFFIIYINSEDQQNVKLFLSSILKRFDSEKKFELIANCINTLQKLRYNFMSPVNFLATLLSMLDCIHPFSLQKIVIEAIIFGNNNKTEDLEQVFDFIHCSLDTDLDMDFLKYLMNKGFDHKSPIGELRFCFIDIVLTRFYRSNNPDVKNFVVENLNENQEGLQEAVFKRSVFPGWLEKYTHDKGETQEIFDFFDFLFETGIRIGSLDHIKIFFSVSNQVGIYHHLVEKHCGDQSINTLLELHEKLENTLRNRPEVIKKIFNILENSDEFLILINASVGKFRPNELLMIRQTPRSPKSLVPNYTKPLIISYLNLLLLSLDLSPPDSDFTYFTNFISRTEINYFNTKTTDEEPSKLILSIFIFTQIFKKITDGAYHLIPHLTNFIKCSKVHKKLKQVFKKFNHHIEDAINEEIFSESCGLYNHKELQTKFYQKLDSLKSTQEPFLSYIQSSDFQHSTINLYSNIIKTLSIVFTNFSNTQIPEKRVSEDFPYLILKHSDFIKKIKHSSTEATNTQRFDQLQETISRDLWKLEQDYKSFKKKLVNLKCILDSNPANTRKVRQIYDKFGRWSTTKPLKSFQNKIQKLKIEQNYSCISPLLPKTEELIKESVFVDDVSESPNTTMISENSAVNLKEVNKDANLKSNSSVYSGYCERIKVQGSFFARFNVSAKFLELVFEGQIRPDSPDFPGALSYTRSKVSKRRVWLDSEFSEVLFKRFIHHESALEFILTSGKSYFLNFFHKKSRNEVLRFIHLWNMSKTLNPIPVDLENFTDDWKKGQISNFEYLMILNKYSSRSFHDLSQYPIFPWVLSDYFSDTFSYNDPKKLRNLKFPVGAQSEELQKRLLSKFKSFKNETLEAYHHGSHYSNAGIIVHFLLRIEPYTTQAKELQGGKFDLPDRLFISMNHAWESCNLGIGGDVKELIPELFFSPFVFNNRSGQCFGRTCDGSLVNDTEKPTWALSNWDFIVKHRNVLESSSVSKELHNWIDLIFGCKQTGKAAENSFNVFTAATYKEKYKQFCKSHDFGEIAAMTDQVYHFGQVPATLFAKKPHPVREDLQRNFELFTFFYCNQDCDLETVVSNPRIRKNGKVNFMFMLNDSILVVKTDEKITSLCKFLIKENNEVLVHSTEYVLQSFLAVSESVFLYNCKNFEFGQVQFVWSNNNFAVFNSKYLIAGLDITNSVKVFDFKGKLVQALQFHTMPVICIACTPDAIFSAGFDVKIKSWKWDSKEAFKENLSFYGHCSPVTALRVLDSYQILVSASQGLILTHDIKSGDCLNKVEANSKCIDVNEIGVLAVGCLDKILFFGVNLDQISEYEIKNVKSVKISLCGNFCFAGLENRVMVFDIFDISKQDVQECVNAFDFVMHPLEKQVYLISENGNDVIINILRIFSKKQRETAEQLINELV